MTVEATARYTPGGVETGALDRWLSKVAEAEARTLDWGTVTIKSMRRTNAMTARAAGRPPVPLPSVGSPGERLTIINELPGGFSEQWTFQWVPSAGDGGGGSWKQTDYETHAPVSGQDRPEEL